MNAKFVVSILTLFAAASLQNSAAEPARKPNVLFIAVDDLNDWAMGGRPDLIRPNLQRLMDSGVTFDNAHCSSPSCHPSRVAIMTGVPTYASGVDHNVFHKHSASWRTGPESGTGILKDAVILSKHFQNHGYTALGTGKIFHGLQWLDGSENEADAWDQFYPSAESQIPFQPRPKAMVSDKESGIIGNRPLNGKVGRTGQVFGAAPLQISDDEMSDGKTVAWALEQMQQPQDQPLFLAVGLFRPHMPWEVPQKYFDLYPLDSVVPPINKPGDLDDTHGHAREHWHAFVMKNEINNQMWQRLIQGYLASITFMDAQLGRLLDGLAASPMADNTIVVLWSDHGMHMGEKSNWEKFTLWERSTHVPLLIKAPGIGKPSSSVTSPASLVDVYPTLCELADLPIPEQCMGISLVPQMKDPKAPRTMPAISSQTVKRQDGHAVRTEHWRYIRYYDGFEELYNHQNDPNEYTNIADTPEYAEIKARMLQHLVDAGAPLDGHYVRADTGELVADYKARNTKKKPEKPKKQKKK